MTNIGCHVHENTWISVSVKSVSDCCTVLLITVEGTEFSLYLHEGASEKFIKDMEFALWSATMAKDNK